MSRHRVDPRAGEFDRLGSLVADHPRIVPGRNVIDVIDADFACFARIAFHMEPPVEYDPLIMDLARMSMRDRTYVPRPSPSGLKYEPPDHGLAMGYDLDSPVRKAPNLFRIAKTLSLYTRHRIPGERFRGGTRQVREYKPAFSESQGYVVRPARA